MTHEEQADLTGAEHAERVPPHDIRDGDVIQDPHGGGWITVTRIVSGRVTATSDTRQASTALWSFYGDERIDEVITVYSDDAPIARRI